MSINGEATDDLGLERVEVQGRVVDSESSPESTLNPTGGGGAQEDSLKPGGAVAQDAQFSQVVWTREVVSGPLQRRVPVALKQAVSSLVGVGGSIAEGQQIELWIEARDSAGQIGRSARQRLRIRSDEDVLKAIDAKEQNVWQRFQESLQAQKQNFRSASRIVKTVDASQQVAAEDVESLSVMTQIQSSIANQISDSESGVLGEVRELKELYQQNGLQGSSQAGDVSELLDALESLAAKALSDSVRRSQKAKRSASQDLGQSDTAAASTSTVEDLQRMQSAFGEVLEQMQSIQGSQSAAASIRESQTKLATILSNQESLLGEAQKFQLDSLQGLSVVDAKRRAASLSADQLALAEETLDVIQSAMKDGDESSASLIAGIAKGLSELGLSDRMRQAAESLAQRRTDVAMQRQQEAIEMLQGALLSSEQASSPLNQRLSRKRSRWRKRRSSCLRLLVNRQSWQTRLLPHPAGTWMTYAGSKRSLLEKLTAVRKSLGE